LFPQALAHATHDLAAARRGEQAPAFEGLHGPFDAQVVLRGRHLTHPGDQLARGRRAGLEPGARGGEPLPPVGAAVRAFDAQFLRKFVVMFGVLRCVGEAERIAVALGPRPAPPLRSAACASKVGRDMNSRRLVLAALALLVLWTLGVRLVGIDFLEPQWTEQDTQLVQHLRVERTGNADEGESGYTDAYPYLLPYLLRAQPRLIEVAETPQTLEEHLTACKSLFTETRLFIALLSCLTIPLSFLLARRFTSPPWALFASALVSASLLTHTFAQQARPHAAAAPFMLLAVVAALRLRASPSWANYVLAGLAAALGAGRAAQRRGGRARGTCGALPARRPAPHE
jgi:hypothetical protein